MNEKRPCGFVRFLNMFATILLAVIFVIAASVVPVYYSVAGFARPETISSVFQNIDYELIEAEAILDEVGVEDETVEEIIKSKEFGNLVEGFSGLIVDEVFSGDEESQVTVDSLKKLAEDHSKDIVAIVEKATGEKIDEAELKKNVVGIIEENAADINQSLSGLKETMAPVKSVSATIIKSVSTPITILVVLALVIILGLIYLLRRRNFGGFIWIAVLNGIVAEFLLAIVILVNGDLLNTAMAELDATTKNLVNAVLSVIDTKLIIALIVTLVLTIGSIIACIFLRRAKNRRLCAETTAEPVVEELEAEASAESAE